MWYHAAKPDGAVKASIGPNSARRSNEQRGRSNKIAGNEGGQLTFAKWAPRNLRAAKVALTSASDTGTELAELETDNTRLRALLAEKLRVENAILRKLLQLH